MFDSLSSKLNTILSRLRGKGKLSEADVDSALREIRLALLEADVNYKVAKELIAGVHDRAIGSEVLESLTPGQQVVKVIRDELTALMGEERIGLLLTNKPAVIMLVGLQGCGKTTTAAKLALTLKKEGKKSVLVAADVYRPAEEIELPVFEQGNSPLQIVTGARDWAEENLCDVVIIDTAGRLQIDQSMMNELAQLKNATSPDEILLVADAMTGQEAVNIASSFHEKLSLSGVVLNLWG
jgi:signal recognition particle subunit SRP54